MTFIKTINPQDADGRLKTLYDRIKGPDGNIDNILLAHSLRPHSLEGHMALYKNVLHHNRNDIPKWFLETIGVYVSLLNDCRYCVDHHFAGLTRLINDGEKANDIRQTLESALNVAITPSRSLTNKENYALNYARALTHAPATITQATIDELRAAGWQDGEILEINQVTAYFCYANRTVLGLGVNTDGDEFGLSPNNSDNENDWGHQ